MSSDPSIQQTVIGSNNIFSATGDVYVIQNPLPPAEAKTRRDLGILLKKVKTFWIEGVLEKSLHNTILIELGKESKPESIDHPWESILELPDQASRVLPHETKIRDIFEQSNRALLILGEPGSGKTITMLELARDLILQAENDREFVQAVPVIFNLSSWATKSQSLMDWMISELTLKYQVPKKVGLEFLKETRILPMLDGLDEVKKESRDSCVEAINAFAKDFGLSGLVVCCRLADYTQLSSKLKLNAAICLQPLSARQVDEYLGKVGEMDHLRLALSQDQSLQELAQSPLMLGVMSLIYRGESTIDLINPKLNLPRQREHLFSAYITKMLNRRGTRAKLYTDEQTIGWLSWLAKQMQNHKETMFLIEQLQPSWLPIHNQRRYQYAPLWVIIVTLGITLSWWKIERGFMPSLSDWLGYVLSAMVFGWLIWPLVWHGNIKPVETLKLSKQMITDSLQAGAFFGGALFLFTIICGFLIELTGIFEFEWISWLMKVWPLSALSSSASASSWLRLIIFLLYLYSLVWIVRIVNRLINIIGWKKTEWIVAAIVLLHIIWRYLMVPNFVVKVLGALTAWVTVGLIGFVIVTTLSVIYGLLSGLTYAQVDSKTEPNQGIRQSVWNGLLVGSIGLLPGGLIGTILWVSLNLDPKHGFEHWLFTPNWSIMIVPYARTGGIVGAIIGGLIGIWAYGGNAFIKHYVLRLFLSLRPPHLPWQLARFLDHSADYIFLRKVGGGYIFIHRFLMEHFAGMGENSISG